MSLCADEDGAGERYQEEKKKEDLTTLEEEVLILNLVDSEELGPAVRAVYERGVQESFAAALGRYKAEREAEIYEACGQENALDFIRSVDAIVTVKDELSRLDGMSEDINSEVCTCMCIRKRKPTCVHTYAKTSICM